MLKIKTTGLDSAIRRLEKLADNAKALDGKHSVPISELLTNEFVRQHSRFATLDELFAASGFKTQTKEDFAAIPDAEWDSFIKANTSFADWQSMLSEASGAWARRKLEL